MGVCAHARVCLRTASRFYVRQLLAGPTPLPNSTTSTAPHPPHPTSTSPMCSIFINNAYRHHLRHAPNITTVQT